MLNDQSGNGSPAVRRSENHDSIEPGNAGFERMAMNFSGVASKQVEQRRRPLTARDDHGRRQVSKTTIDPALIGIEGTVGAPMPTVVDRETWQKHLDKLLVREKALTREGDDIAAARRRLPMVEVDATTIVVGRDGPVSLRDVFDGRRQLVVYYHMWHDGQPAPGQCEGCSFFNGHVHELSFLHSRDVTYAAFCEVHTQRVPVTTPSWAGRCRGTPQRTRRKC